MTDLERDAIDGNYPSYSDFVKVAQNFYPMDQQLHQFIIDVCTLCGWPVEATFKRIFRES